MKKIKIIAVIVYAVWLFIAIGVLALGAIIKNYSMIYFSADLGIVWCVFALAAYLFFIISALINDIKDDNT